MTRAQHREVSQLTDLFSAEIAAQELGGGYRYVPQWGNWIEWNGHQWCETGAEYKVALAFAEVMRHEYREVNQRITSSKRTEENEYDRKLDIKLRDHFEQCQNGSKISSCVKLMRGMLSVSSVLLDSDPMLFNSKSGTIDLRKGMLTPSKPSSMITKISPVLWERDAECPIWDAFMLEVMGGDQELVSYLQRLVGYAMTGNTIEHVIIFLYGGGRNGKSTFLSTIYKLFGDYAVAAPRDLLFEDKKGQRHPAEIARLHGKRFALCSEIGDQVTLDEAKVKDLTSGEPIAVRKMGQDFWDMTPTHTFFVAGNHKPRVNNNDVGIWRRIRLVPWTFTIAENAVDHHLQEKLDTELPGILQWAVRGCMAWQESRLMEPAPVSRATASYREESDPLGEFVRTNLVIDRAGAHPSKTPRSQLRTIYEQWCREEGHSPVGAKRMSARLREMGAADCNMIVNGKWANAWKYVRLKVLTDHVAEQPS